MLRILEAMSYEDALRIKVKKIVDKFFNHKQLTRIEIATIITLIRISGLV